MLSAVTGTGAAIGRSVAAASLLAAGVLAASSGTASAQSITQQVRTADIGTLRQIDVPAAWPRTMGSGVTVAVLDTGMQPGVPDLAGQVTVGPDFAAGADPRGYAPPHLHGTYIGSIIAGHGSGPGRAAGMIGVAPRARILAVRVILDDQEPGFAVYNENAQYDDAIANGIRYAVRHGAQVINMSLGGTHATRSVRQAIAYAISHDVVVVAAAGNSGRLARGFTAYSYPAAFTGVISVAAVTPRGQRASFSDRNSSVVVSAPGVRVVGAGPGGSYLVGSGTSPASAFVAGVAALIRSRYPRLTPVQVMQAIVTSVRRRPPGGYSPATGFGEVDAAAAITAAGRLAAGSARQSGVAASAFFGRGQCGPIEVVHHDHLRIAVLAVTAAAATLAFVSLVVAAAIVARRRRLRSTRPPAVPPPVHIAEEA